MTNPTSSRRDIRVGLIGYGLAGSVFHAPLITATPGLTLAAIVTRDPARREQAARDNPGVPLLDSAERLWERAGARGGDIDLAVVAAPNGTHASLAMAALEAGLHVVVDKPFAPTAAAARMMIDEANRRGLRIVPFHNRRWDGDLLTVRRLLRDGVLGTVQRFESRYERWRPSPKARWCAPDARANAESIAYDLGTHIVDQALLLFGAVSDVYAEIERRHPDVRTEDDVFIALTHASGVRSHLYTSAVAAQQGPRMTVLGSRAAYVKHGMDPQEEALKGGARPGPAGWGEEPAERWGQVGAGDDVRRAPTEPGDYPRFYAGIVAMLRDGAPPPVAPGDAVAGLDVLEAAFASSADRRVVRLG